MSLRIIQQAAGVPARGAHVAQRRRPNWASALTFISALLVAAAISPAGVARADECPNAAFRTGPSTHLPDCRAYELVSPADKNEGAPYLEAYGPDGLSATLSITAGTAGLEGFPLAGLRGPVAFYTTQRTASGWTTVAADPPSSEYTPFGESLVPNDFEGDDLNGLTTVWVDRAVWQSDNSLGIFERLPDHSIVGIGPGLPPTAPAGSVLQTSQTSGLQVQGVSSDGSHIVFSLHGDFWPFDSTEGGRLSLYEYIGTGNATPLLVGVDEAGALISSCGTELGSGEGGPNQANGHNSMSTDGQTIFFTAKCGARTGHELYARIDNGQPDARTVDISEPSKADCAICDTEAGALTEDAHFEGASQDGSRVFFSTTQPLLGSDTSRNLYEYDFDAPAGQRLTRVAGAATDADVDENTHTLLSEDGSHIYFLATGVLTSVPNGEGETAQAGAENLYVFERDASYPDGRVEFVAGLSGEDLGLWKESSAAGDVTPDGRFLVFASERDLTPDDTSERVQQIFEYDAQTGALLRVSKGQNGFNNDGNVPPIPLSPGLTQIFDNADNARIATPGIENLGSATDSFYYSRYAPAAYSTGTSVSADGSYVFFESIVGLTPQALDRRLMGYDQEQSGRVSLYANNVYEYHDGQVSLISDGQDLAVKQTSYIESISAVKLLTTDESGQDVLFTTVDKLVGQDTDTTQDIYDARIAGGFPAPVVPTACSGESCQGALSGAPEMLSPGSEFQAGGNPPLSTSPAPKAAVKPKPKAKPKKCGRSGVSKRDKCNRNKNKKASKAGDKRRSKS